MNFIDKKEKQLQNNFDKLTSKAKQNSVLRVMNLIKTEELEEMRKAKMSVAKIQYIEELYSKLQAMFEEYEVADESK